MEVLHAVSVLEMELAVSGALAWVQDGALGTM